MIGRRLSYAGVALAISTLAAACGDQVRDIETRRARYRATLSGFVVKDQPGREKPQIVLDVLVAGDSQPPLPGLTLDVSMASADGKEKWVRQVFVDTASVDAAGEERAVVFDDLDFRPGDRFWVEVRNPIPAAERGNYLEFSGGELGSPS